MRHASPSPTWPPFVELGPGRLAIDHRPKARALDLLKAAGCTHVLTLLSEREGAEAIGKAVAQAGLEWLWFPLQNGDPPPARRDPEFRDLFERLGQLLGEGRSILIHCSAGIHRTGMVAYALLRYLQLPTDDARERLRAMREVTASSVGEARLAWGERFALRGTVSER